MKSTVRERQTKTRTILVKSPESYAPLLHKQVYVVEFINIVLSAWNVSPNIFFIAVINI